jgi:hypothetical protein
MGSTPTSQSLLHRVRDPADAGSWRKLLDLYAPLIRRWVRPNVRQPADATGEPAAPYGPTAVTGPRQGPRSHMKQKRSCHGTIERTLL